MKIFVSKELNNKAILFSENEKKNLFKVINELSKNENIEGIKNIRKLPLDNMYEYEDNEMRLFLTNENENMIILDAVGNFSENNNINIIDSLNPKVNRKLGLLEFEWNDCVKCYA
jgi:hypothetical protein